MGFTYFFFQEGWNNVLKNSYAYKKLLGKIAELEETYTCEVFGGGQCLTGDDSFCPGSQAETQMVCRALDRTETTWERMEQHEEFIYRMVRIL